MVTGCDNEEEHGALVGRVKAAMPSDEKISEMGARFKVISEPSRLKILLALAHGELCVEHITEAVSGNQSAVSHQVRILRANGIVKARRDGQNIVYSLADEHVTALLELACTHLNCKF